MGWVRYYRRIKNSSKTFIRILYGFSPYHFQPFGSCNILLPSCSGVGHHGRLKHGGNIHRVEACKTYSYRGERNRAKHHNHYATYEQIVLSLRLFCSFNSIINYVGRFALISPFLHSHSTVWRRRRANWRFSFDYMVFVFVCRFQLNPDWKVTSLGCSLSHLLLDCKPPHTREHHHFRRSAWNKHSMSYKSWDIIISRIAIHSVLALVSISFLQFTLLQYLKYTVVSLYVQA